MSVVSMETMYRNNKAAKGFTIVELLIVVVVIAILASITVTAYSGIQQRANNSQQLATVENWQKSLMLAATQGATIPNSADPQCLGTASDYPAQDGFLANQCLSLRGTGVSVDVMYAAANFTSWAGVAATPSAKMPIKSIVDSSSGTALTYKARGMWLVGPIDYSSGGVQLAWLPQTTGQCGAGSALNGICVLMVRF